MGRLRILAAGATLSHRANARGKLFEDLMTQVLRHHGYSIDDIPNVNYSGMEIDIEGQQTITGIPLYCECKCYETEVDSPKLQAFYGKYLAKWFKDQRCHGLFVALPGINSHAKAFYRDNCESNGRIVLRLLEEHHVLDTIYEAGLAVRPESIGNLIPSELGTAGDSLLLFTERSCFWAQYVIPAGSKIPRSVLVADGLGRPMTDPGTLDYISGLLPELKDFELLRTVKSPLSRPILAGAEPEEIVEVRGSSACFEYQFPASPEFFVGRSSALEEFDIFADALLAKTSSSRGILFEANSGWGKSSLVLACAERLNTRGHFAVAIDSRSASSSQFILRALNHVFSKFGDFGGAIGPESLPGPIAGFQGAIESLLAVGRALEKKQKLLLIFFDQFENMFVLSDALRHIRDIFLKLCDVQTNVAFGFSWKTDLIGLTTEFPYQLRDALAGGSKRVPLEPFSDLEAAAMFGRLSSEIKAKLRKDLQFFLSEFSQGYPWLLKKLCAHVKAQRDKNVPQLEMVDSLLNVDELFKEDLRGLSPEEEEVLRKIAKVAPIGVSELRDELKSDLIQSLVNSRLIVRIGVKLDVYWDIFRDYLNTGRLPVQDNYVLRLRPTSVLRATKALVEAGRQMPPKQFQRLIKATNGSFYNITREMRLLGLASVSSTDMQVNTKVPEVTDSFENDLRPLVKERLTRNRLISRVRKELDAKGSIPLGDIAVLISNSCPYISAQSSTWLSYARTVATWMNFADLALLDNRRGLLTRHRSDRAVREAYLSTARRVYGVRTPRIQFGPVERAALAIIEAIKTGQRVDWSGFNKSTIAKALGTLEDIGFVTREVGSLSVNPELITFATEPLSRSTLFAQGALKMPAFAAFVELLASRPPGIWTHPELAKALAEKLDVDWKPSTASINVKIMMDWARHCGLQPALARSRKLQPPSEPSPTLFDSE
jgi:hypothetical protein